MKAFCIGAGRTGTTSLAAFFRSSGFEVGDQAAGEILLQQWAAREFGPIVALAKTAQVFQDFPFSAPFTFQALDAAFPDAKFILSVRRDADEWYQSLVRFHTKIVGKGRIPTADDLREFPYRHKGWIFEAMRLVYGVSEDAPYDKATLVDAYEYHNYSIKQYFKHRDSLLIVNVADPDSSRKVIEFVGGIYNAEQMPHLNRSN